MAHYATEGAGELKVLPFSTTFIVRPGGVGGAGRTLAILQEGARAPPFVRLRCRFIVRRGVRGEREGSERSYRKGPVPRRTFYSSLATTRMSPPTIRKS